ncbi:isoprenoid biosynthesis glyoxalase ElbB [Fastidiosibacter lacustris]|uniref:isoprenoid biosynthesis glyoxalase ElbB n=1 Tax=Fastidiosibacter lacustris TaxID=2056695 RepID=UPI000E356D62|nr:isoprenoid biosynthesis glyoxalase ElbB [Fastidiosibacter lacustris]
MPNQTKKVAVLLAGCGSLDGSEIHEAVLTLLSLSKRGIDYEVIAPNKNQHHVINHITGQEMSENRNMLVEAARIARGKIKDLAQVQPYDYSALVLPGGFGAAKNLCDFAFKQDATYQVDSQVKKFIEAFKGEHKPVGFICIAPVIAAEIYPSVSLTIGQDEAIANILQQKGAKHVKECVSSVCIDHDNQVVTTPAYMLGKSIAEVAEGIDKLIEAVASLIDEKIHV